VESIGSIKDERITLARALKASKGRLEHRRILLEGEEILEWAVQYGIVVEFVLSSDRIAADIEARYAAPGRPVFAVSDGILKKVTDTSYLVPVVGVARMPSQRPHSGSEFVVVLDSVRDLGNIGTVIRTCQAFGIRTVIATSDDFDIFHRKTIEASRGSVFATEVVRFTGAAEAVAHLRSRGYQIVATSPRGSELQSMVELQRRPVALIVGSETDGISPAFAEQADFLIQIPMSPAVESLNVGVATGISIYELKLKQVLAMMEDRIKSTLGRELNVTGWLVQAALDTELRKVSDLSSRQVVFMMVLRCDRKMSVPDMCKQFGVLETDAGPFLEPLIESSLVATDGDLVLTARGEEVLARLWPTVERAEQRLLADFTTEEVGAFMKQLRSIQAQCALVVDGNA
jgi:RNA methyltransferase, TrmH family